MIADAGAQFAQAAALLAAGAAFGVCYAFLQAFLYIVKGDYALRFLTEFVVLAAFGAALFGLVFLMADGKTEWFHLFFAAAGFYAASATIGSLSTKTAERLRAHRLKKKETKKKLQSEK